jgi:cell division inhibitor SepF
MFQKIGAFFSLRDEESDEYYEEEQPSSPARVISLAKDSRRRGFEVGVFAPRGFQDVVQIADALRNRHVVIVNLQNADRSLLQRVVDFASGVAYTLDGKIQKLSEAMYLVVPAGVSVNAEGMRDAVMAGTFDFMSK